MALSKGETRGSTGITNIFDNDSNMSYDLGINEGAIAHIINRLTDLYKNPIDATVRETISNAIDAVSVYKSAGNEVSPIEISSPSNVSPFFIVRDHGVGMSLDTIRKVFTQYGGTTKSGAYNQTGSYGLGAKAPLAYTDEYEIITTNEGITTKFIIFRNDSGPRVNIVYSENTGDTSGTVVKIPVRNGDFNSFISSLETYKKFSFDNPIRINDVEFFGNDDYILAGSVIIESEDDVSGRVWIHKGEMANIIKAIELDNVYDPYPYVGYLLNGYIYYSPKVNRRWGTSETSYREIIVELKPGVVDFSSSRDEITSNDRIIMLDTLVREQWSKGSDILYESFLNNLQSLTMKEGIELFESSSLNPVVNGDRVVFDSCDTVWSVSDLNSTDGNFIKNVSKISKSSVYFIACNQESKSSRSVITSSNDENRVLPEPSKINANGKVADYQTLILDTFKNSVNDEGERFSIADAAYAISKNKQSYNKVFFVPVSSETEVCKVVRQRKALSNSADSHMIVFFDASYTLSKTDKSFINLFLDKERVAYKSLNELVEYADKYRTATNSRSNGDSVLAFTLSKNGYPDRKSVVMGSIPSYLPFKTNSIAEMNKENTLYIPFNYQNGTNGISSVLNGYLEVHGDNSLDGRPVVIIKRPTKGNFDIIGNFDNVAFYSGYSHASDAVNKHVSGHSYSRSVDNEKAVYTDDSALLSAYIYKKVQNVHSALDNVEKLSDCGHTFSLTQRAINFSNSYLNKTNCSTTIILSDEDLRRRVGDDVFIELQAFLSVVGTFQINSYWSQKPFEFAFGLATSNDNVPDYLVTSSVSYIDEVLEKNFEKAMKNV